VGHFLAEIPCFRELTGNLDIFECGNVAGLARGATEFRGSRANSCLQKQGIQNRETGNTNLRNREYKSQEQGIQNRRTGNPAMITGNHSSSPCGKPDQNGLDGIVGDRIQIFRPPFQRMAAVADA
jgi:hypothetical protein